MLIPRGYPISLSGVVYLPSGDSSIEIHNEHIKPGCKITAVIEEGAGGGIAISEYGVEQGTASINFDSSPGVDVRVAYTILFPKLPESE